MHFLTEGIHSLCWVGYVKIQGNIAASISVSCSFRKQSSLREGPTVFWVIYCTFHHNGNTKYPIPSRYSWLGIAWALFLRRCPDSHCPQSTHCLGVMLLQHPPCSSYSWALSGSVEKWVNLHVSKLLWVCFPLGGLNLFFFCCWKWKLSYMAVYSSDSPWCWGQPELKHGSPLWHALATNQDWSTHSADSFISSERLPGLCQLPWSSVMEACHLSVLGWRPIGKPFREIRQ